MPRGFLLKLSKGKKLLVFFGCLPIEEDESEKEDEVRVLKWEDKVKRALSQRTKIIEGLNKSREVRDVSDLFKKLRAEFVFNPIVFKIHLPLSLQKARYIWGESIRAEIEDFELVYDGFILMVATLCDLDKFPFGVYDVKDRIEKVLEPIIEIKGIVPPTLYAAPVTFLIQGDSIAEKGKGLFINVEKPTESRTLLRKLYTEIYYEVGRFFETCSLSKEINEEVQEIERAESRLLGNLRDFLNANWKQIRRKRSLISQCKKDMADILEKVSRYLSDQNTLKRECKDFRRFVFRRDTLFIKFTKLIDTTTFDFYTEPYRFLDTDSVIRVVDHVRSEIEAYSLNTSTLFSALLGAVVGSVITLVVSYLL